MSIISKIALITVLIVSFSSCRKTEDYPDTPEIEYKSFETYKDSAVFTFSFTDGDGDIGLRKSDTTGKFSVGQKYYYNLFLEYYEMKNGQFEKIDLIVPFYYRIPFVDNEGRDKTLQGDISVTLTPFYYDFTSPYDTLKYEAYLVDRDLNESNIIETPELIKPN